MVRRLLRREPEPLRLRAPAALRDWRRSGTAPLAAPADPSARLHVSIVVPSFRKGSGGHSTIANLIRGLEALGHECSIRVEDDEGLHEAAGVEASFNDFFGPVEAPVELGFDGWRGADVVLATGWQTVHRALVLPGAGARAYLVQDHEPEFYGTSAERLWAEHTYGLGLHCICASPWLAALVRERYGASASHFDLGVRHDLYKPTRIVERFDDLVLLYARAVTPRRGVPLGVLALEELVTRRPGLRPLLFGEDRPLATPFLQAHVESGEALAARYSHATVGVVISLTNPSLVPTEMLACGLPCVDVASDAMLSTFGREGPIVLAEPDPLAIADAVEALLDDPAERERRAAAGLELVAGRTWDAASAQVEAGLREAVALAADARS